MLFVYIQSEGKTWCQFIMVNLTFTLLAAFLLTQLLIVIYGMDVRNSENMRNDATRDEWNQLGQINGNEMAQVETVADLIKVSPWSFYPNRDKLPTFARIGRNSISYHPRVSREDEIQFTETSRSPPFAPRLGRVLHYSPRFRRLSMN